MRYDPERGFIVLPDILSDAEVSDILTQCDTLRNKPPDELAPRDKPHAGTVHLERLVDRIEEVKKLVENPTLTQAVVDIVGETNMLVQATLRCPRPGYGQQQLHTDDVPKADDGPCRVATVIVPLVQFSSLNGATRLIPASHRRPDLQQRPGDGNRHIEEEIIAADKGSAIVFSGHLVHSGRKNTSDSERPALQLIWHRQL